MTAATGFRQWLTDGMPKASLTIFLTIILTMNVRTARSGCFSGDEDLLVGEGHPGEIVDVVVDFSTAIEVTAREIVEAELFLF